MATMNQELLVAELDTTLADCLRRAANRAEHIRLARLQELLGRLKEELAAELPGTSTATSVDG
jgi:hypothetical protein